MFNTRIHLGGKARGVHSSLQRLKASGPPHGVLFWECGVIVHRAVEGMDLDQTNLPFLYISTWQSGK